LRAPTQCCARKLQRTTRTRVVDTWRERVAAGTPDGACYRPATIENPDRSGEQRQSIDKVSRSIDGVNNPCKGRIIPAAQTSFLTDDRVGRKLCRELLAQQTLDGAIGSADEIRIRRGARRRWFEFHLRGVNVGGEDVFARQVRQARGGGRQRFLDLGV